jgi:hypothetical protein
VSKITLEINISATLGVKVEGNNEREVIQAGAFFHELPSNCPVCKAPVVLSYRQPQGFTYYGLKCTGNPSHESKFGQHKEGGTLYYKNEWRAFGVESSPEAEHDQLESRIWDALKAVGRSDAQLNEYVQKKYQTDSKWQELSTQYKREVLAFLEGKKSNGASAR